MKSSKGFTLIELAVVIAIYFIICTFMWFFMYFHWLFNHRRFRSINEKLKPLGLRVRLMRGKVVELYHQGKDGYWSCEHGMLRVIVKNPIDSWGHGERFKSGCFYGDRDGLKRRLYVFYRNPRVMAFRLAEIESLGIDVSGWPKDSDEYHDALYEGDPRKVIAS